MINVLDLDDAGLLSESAVEEWEEEFQARFFGPLIQAQRLQAFLAMSPQERAEAMREKPDHGQRMTRHADRLRRYYDGTK